jgi:hypothetical protein
MKNKEEEDVGFILKLLPASLMKEVNYGIFTNTVLKNHFLCSFDENSEVINMILHDLKPVRFQSYSVIYNCKDIADRMFFIIKGQVEM